MAIRCIVGVNGYIESSKISYLVFMVDEPFETRYAALQSLAKQLLNQYEEEECKIFRFRQCCKEVITAYCPQCGKHLEYKLSFDNFASWICELHGKTSELAGDFEFHGPWWPWMNLERLLDTPKNEILYLAERMEEYLIHALDHEDFTTDEMKALEESNIRHWSFGHDQTPFEQYLEKDKFSTRGPR